MKKKMRYFDYSMMAVLVCLVCFGLVMLYSTSAYSALIDYGDSMYYFKRQIIFCAAGFIGMWIVSRINYHFYIKWAKSLYFLSVLLMLLVQTPLGKTVNGARRWIKLPFNQQFQPAEVTKIAVILFIPVVIIKLGKEARTLKGIGRVLLWGGFSALCVYKLTDNLSTAIIVFGITCMMIFVTHPKTKPFIALAAAGLGAVIVGVQVLARLLASSDNFRVQRIITWLDPEKYAAGDGFQILQGLYAIGSGGFFGKGLGNSAQKMVIPEVQNDMILSVICEELGVFGAIMILVLFAMLLYRLIFIAQNAPDMYGSMIVTGIFAHIALQVILNVAVVTNLIPTTGITLPFISYGGTSLLFLMAEMGIAFGVSGSIKIDE
ncbi:MAG: putative lipid II flippase FtsW [Lachnospiraceae bacterium]